MTIPTLLPETYKLLVLTARMLPSKVKLDSPFIVEVPVAVNTLLLTLLVMVVVPLEPEDPLEPLVPSVPEEPLLPLVPEVPSAPA